MKKGFTLAEVLITLGIIGVVAALTLPNLIANYKKKVVVTRLQKLYSTYKNAIQFNIAENSQIDDSMITEAHNAEQIMQYFETNLKPYMNTVSVKKKTYGIAVEFLDGSGLYVGNYAYEPASPGMHIRPYLCIHYKSCLNIDETKAYTAAAEAADGKEIFAIWVGGTFAGITNNDNILAQSREALINECKIRKYVCGWIIQQDGWQILDDYPVKL